MEKEKLRAEEMDFQAAPEQDSCDVVTGTAEIERGECSCEINRYFVSDFESFVEFE